MATVRAELPIEAAPTTVYPSIEPRFVAVCEVCPWMSREYADSLTALHAHDRHVITLAHQLAQLNRLAVEDSDDD